MNPHPSPPDPAKALRIQQMFVMEISNLRGFLWTLVPDRHRLDDVIQETFLTVTRKADTFEEGTNFRAWVFTIGRHKALQSLRERRHEGYLAPEVLEAITEDREPPDGHFDERAAHLRDCIAKLPGNARQMISLRYTHRKSLAEIADVLSFRPASVKVMLSRFRSLLRNCIERKLRQIPNPP
ncbi:sigma-70 family RNA polymerase sigma factor [Luteolibacter ambystomatis]|uniref:Sigma-70 family RNA polymerase sigma factor n=1 Tax=Luteolibacter ambystomatis TaxID=2824561 RepID=A0A975PHD0_9BACT|nr:sigma-70 family RNA polymerase sigma factor [Luteolibacter ambystomatis]QUE53156.1 sigma-70 family RNA polymerase sigma factor [Luteolibacter ambystomatis]